MSVCYLHASGSAVSSQPACGYHTHRNHRAGGAAELEPVPPLSKSSVFN